METILGVAFMAFISYLWVSFVYWLGRVTEYKEPHNIDEAIILFQKKHESPLKKIEILEYSVLKNIDYSDFQNRRERHIAIALVYKGKGRFIELRSKEIRSFLRDVKRCSRYMYILIESIQIEIDYDGNYTFEEVYYSICDLRNCHLNFQVLK